MPPLPERPSSNILEVTVGELSGALKRTIEDRFGFVRVRGEISNYRGPHSSGHAYFCLKDDAARIDAVIWKTALQRMKIRPQEGLEVIATGRVTTFPGKSTYQIVIEAIEPAGLGALMALLEQRRKMLAAEGLFAADRKRAIPFLPRVVGVVTSPTGAVIRDILHRIADRFPRDVLVWPVRVQGDTAAAEVAAAIAGFNALPPSGSIARPEVLIVARGGGSLEDLWAFNEEIVVRAAAAGTIPLISAVGHETDTTLLDHVADLRAPTPSGAAEKAVPVRADLIGQLNDIARRQVGAVTRLGDRRRAELRGLARALPSADSVTAVARQRFDRATERLSANADGSIHRRYLELMRLAHRLSRQSPHARLAQRRAGLDALGQRLPFASERGRERRASALTQLGDRLSGARNRVEHELWHQRARCGRIEAALPRALAVYAERRRQRLAGLEKLLETLGYRQVLSRGYALVRDSAGRPLHSAQEAASASFLDIEFADGHIDVASVGPTRTRRSRPRPRADQGSLFESTVGSGG